MGGKNYFCDYCRCFLKNDIKVRKVHISGLSHTIAKVSYMRRFEDPRQLLAEESAKVPCTRFLKGYCKFDQFCQFTHFNEKQFQQLHKIVNKLNLKAQQKRDVKNNAASKDWQRLLPWNAAALTKVQGKRAKLLKRLPPSLKPINFNKLNAKCLNAQWG